MASHAGEARQTRLVPDVLITASCARDARIWAKAASYIQEFIDPKTPWLHLDIAGPAYNDKKAHGYTPVGGTGVALRSLVTLAELAASQSK